MNVMFRCDNDIRIKAKEQIIYCYIRKNNKQLKLNTHIKVEPKYFNNKTQKFKKGYANELVSNKALENFSNDVKSVIANCLIEKPNCNIDEILTNIKEHFKRTDNENFFELYQKFIDEKSITTAKGTIAHHRKIFKHVKAFKSDLMFHHINRNLLEDFEVYLFQVKHQNSNTVNKGVKTFKEFLNWLLSKNYIQNNDFKMYKPKTKNKDTDIFVLSETEINYIADYQISDKKMCAIRDLFIFSCFTGQRYSDVAKFSLENVVEANNKLYWKLKQKKTSNNVMIPLNTKVIDIVKKYRNGLPIQISLDKYNDNIKKLAKMLNFVEPVTLNKLVGTKSVQVTKPKYELFSSHLGRRSFITYQLAKGTISSEVIMSVTGHKSYNEFKKYQKFSLNDIDKIHETSLN